MGSKLSFGTKLFESTTICDYCQYHKCDWIKTTPKRLPRFCPKPKKFEIADDEIPKIEFEVRIVIAKKVGNYYPVERIWQFSIKKAGKTTGQELADVIKTVNSWSEKNDFKLTELIRYKRRTERQKSIEDF